MRANGDRQKIMAKRKIREETPGDRFQVVFQFMLLDVELPVDRADFLTPPDDPYFSDEMNYPQFITFEGRRALYNYILYHQGTLSDALAEWLGSTSIEKTRMELMKQKIAVVGMEMNDFSKHCRPMVPLETNNWRGDGNAIGNLMREIAIFREEKKKKVQMIAQMDGAELRDRKERIEYLKSGLEALNMTVEDLLWNGPEPTRLTYNRLVENGDEVDESIDWDGKAPHSTLDRWVSREKEGDKEECIIDFCLGIWSKKVRDGTSYYRTRT